MIEGVIDSQLDARVEVCIRTASKLERFSALVDTGFTGWLTLSPDQIRGLGLRRRGQSLVGLADGSFALAGRYKAVVVWHGEDRAVWVEEADEPMIEMQMLLGFDLHMSVAPGGVIRIVPTPLA